MDRVERDIFNGFDPDEYEAEARERWGDSDAYRESTRRARGYSAEDWRRFKAETDELNSCILALMAEGVPPTDERAMDAAEGQRMLIDEWFYPCPREMHAALGRMYVEDPPFQGRLREDARRDGRQRGQARLSPAPTQEEP